MKENERKVPTEKWYEVFNLGRRGLSSIDPQKMTRIPNHTFLKF